LPSPTEAPQGVQIPPGILAITSYGVITAETVQCLLDLRGANSAAGINNVHYMIIPGTLVDKARNEAARTMLGNAQLQYLLFLDADMTFGADLVQRLLMTAYSPQLTPWADAVGAWCPLRGEPYLPTIDTGTGTWESHDANMGPVEVIRTGSAAILIKRHVFERMEYPWYGVRPAPRPIDVMAELDNFARCKMDGTNPLRDHPAWQTLENCARQDAAALYSNPGAQTAGGFLSSVGEDSNFCDKMRALGMRIVVQTDAVCGHLERHTISPEMHIAAMKKSERLTRLAVGVLE